MGYDTVDTFLPVCWIVGSYSDLAVGSDCDLVTYSAKGEKTIVTLAVFWSGPGLDACLWDEVCVKKCWIAHCSRMLGEFGGSRVMITK